MELIDWGRTPSARATLDTVSGPYFSRLRRTPYIQFICKAYLHRQQRKIASTTLASTRFKGPCAAAAAGTPRLRQTSLAAAHSGFL